MNIRRLNLPKWSVATLISLVCAACTGETGKTVTSNDNRHCLFTWTVSEDKLCFVLVPFAERDRFVRRGSPKRSANCGVPELKKALAVLPKASIVLWEDNPPEGFNYPPENLMEQVKKFGQEQGLQIVYTPLLIDD